MSWLKAARWLAELKPAAGVDRSLCTRRHESGCSMCAAACPKQAIELSRWSVAVDADACVGCGLCVPACPVEAIGGVGPKAAVVADEMASGVAVRCDVARLLGDEREGTYMDVPCVGVIHHETLAAGAVRAGSATVFTGPCGRCPVGAAQQVTDQILAAMHIVAAAESPARMRHEVVEPRENTEQTGFGARAGPDGNGSRDDTGSGPNDAAGSPGPSDRSVARRPRPIVSRRGLFGFGRRAATDRVPPAEPLSETDATPRALLLAAIGGAALPRVNAAPGCTGCAACVQICPTDALGYAHQSLTFNARDCLGCGECVRICPEDVLTVVPHQPGPSLTAIAHVTVRRCERCAAQLGPGEDGTSCHRCTVRQSLVDDVWNQLGPN